MNGKSLGLRLVVVLVAGFILYEALAWALGMSTSGTAPADPRANPSGFDRWRGRLRRF